MTDAPGTTEPTAVAGGTEDLAERFLVLADHDFAGYSPVYERVARALADDPEALGLLLDGAPARRAAVLALAAVHDVVLGEPDSELARIYRGELDADPWPPFRALLVGRAPEVLGRMRTRSVQTNEVGRSAVLLPALAAVVDAAGDDRPLAIVEVGPSAGLNLFLDRFDVRYVSASGAELGRAGDEGSPVHLRCELRGPRRPPLPVGPLRTVVRTGIDVAPVDVTDDEECRWLEACLWPGADERRDRLRAALAVARSDPPALRTGDALTGLGPLLDELDGDVLPVVVATWALAYLPRDGRHAVAGIVDELGRGRDVALLTAEAPSVTPWVPAAAPGAQAPDGGDGDGTVTALGLRAWWGGTADTRLLGTCHPHGRWLAWADARSATTPDGAR